LSYSFGSGKPIRANSTVSPSFGFERFYQE
jgi:hypothetical protein